MPPEVNVDLFSSSGVGGDIATRLLAGSQNGELSVNALRTNDVLARDEWKHFDDAIIGISRDRLVVTGELVKRGLVMPIMDALGVMSLQWEKSNDMTDAEINMNGLSRTGNESIDFTNESMPIPIIHKDFSLNVRHLLASRKGRSKLDTYQATIAARKVSDTIENLIFTGAQVNATNGTIYGLLNHPNRNTGSVTAAWSGATGEQIVSDVIRMVDVAVAANQYGPFLLLVGTAIASKFGNDYKANGDRTIGERVMQIPGISAIVSSNRVPAGQVVLLQLSPETIRMIDGLQPTLVQWESKGGMELNFKVMAIMVPNVRADAINQCGVVHFS